MDVQLEKSMLNIIPKTFPDAKRKNKAQPDFKGRDAGRIANPP